MTTNNLSRRTLLAGAAASPLALGLTGCTSEKPQGRRPKFVMVFDQNKCVGCGECKEGCNKANRLPEGTARLTLQLLGVAPDGSNKKDRHYVRVSCQQCENAPCVKVCPTGAAHRDPETGIVTMNPDRCVGCKYCITACPYNVRYIRKDTLVADNCDFCLHSRLVKGEEPGCVEACRYDALVFGDLNEPNSYVAKLLDVKDTVRVRPHLGTKPTLRYIPLKKETL